MFRMRVVTAVLICLCLASISIVVLSRESAPAAGNGWNVLADIPHPQYGCGGAVLNKQLHILGGTTVVGGATTIHQAYDPASNTWTEKAPLPDKSAWPAVAVYAGKIYVFGGDKRGVDVKPTDRSFVYDSGKDAWSEIAPLPAPRSYAAAATVGEFIYIFGSRTLRTDTADRTTYRYDPLENTYTRMADLPEGARFISQGVYNGRIYAIHGETDKQTYASGVLRYDVVHNEWTKLNIPRIIQTRWVLTQQSSNVTLGTRLFVAGGSPPEGKRTPLVTYFDMKTKAFGQVEPLPAGRCCGAGGFIDGTLYLAGGFWEEVEDFDTCKPAWGLKLE